MLKGGVIMDVTNVEEARIAEEAGAVAVMALERVPAGVRLCFPLNNAEQQCRSASDAAASAGAAKP
jgi:pyridoxal biosynthesis lyase PdxS